MAPVSAAAGGILALLLLPALMFGYAQGHLYLKQAGVDYPNNDIHPSRGPMATGPCGPVPYYYENATMCKARCDAAAECVGIAHYADGDCCFLKSIMANGPSPNPRVVSYTKAPPYTYTEQAGKDYPGNDIHPSEGPVNPGQCGPIAYNEDAAACEARCDVAAVCAGFAHYADTNCCYIKSAMAGPMDNNRVVAHSKTGYPGYTVEYGQDYPNNDILPGAGDPKDPDKCGATGFALNAGACIARCDNTPACVGIAHYADTSCCYLKTALTGKTANARVASYKNSKDCPPGHAGSSCTICRPGTFSSGGSRQTSVCQACADFSVARYSGSSSCERCPAGYGTTVDRRVCVACRSPGFPLPPCESANGRVCSGCGAGMGQYSIGCCRPGPSGGNVCC